MRLLKEWVDVAEVVEEVAHMVRPGFARKGLSLDLRLEEQLPRLFVDRTRIRQVLLNLVANGLRFTDQGGVTVEVCSADVEVTFCVRDTGPGISQENIPKVFEEFRHIEEGSWRRREGAGLGIPISRHFVELHGGRMWIESVVGQGTAFYFTLPLPGAAHARLAALSAGEADAQHWRWRKQKAQSQQAVFVLSPDPAAGDVIARHVEDYHVVAAQSADEVSEKITQLLPVALILDQQVGEDVAAGATLSARSHGLPVITLSIPGSGGRERTLPGGASGYLVKPVTRRALLKALDGLGCAVGRVLVVDDDPAMVRFVVRVLTSAREIGCLTPGCQVATALTGEEALRRMRDERPDVVLLDLALPDISGWEVLARLRRNPQWSSVPVVLVTAYDWPQMTSDESGDALRVTLCRPFSRHEFAAVLKCLLGTIRPAYPPVSVPPAHPATPSA